MFKMTLSVTCSSFHLALCLPFSQFTSYHPARLFWAGLYSLLLHTHKPQAKSSHFWVFPFRLRPGALTGSLVTLASWPHSWTGRRVPLKILGCPKERKLFLRKRKNKQNSLFMSWVQSLNEMGLTEKCNYSANQVERVTCRVKGESRLTGVGGGKRPCRQPHGQCAASHGVIRCCSRHGSCSDTWQYLWCPRAQPVSCQPPASDPPTASFLPALPALWTLCTFSASSSAPWWLPLPRLQTKSQICLQE